MEYVFRDRTGGSALKGLSRVEGSRCTNAMQGTEKRVTTAVGVQEVRRIATIIHVSVFQGHTDERVHGSRKE